MKLNGCLFMFVILLYLSNFYRVARIRLKYKDITKKYIRTKLHDKIFYREWKSTKQYTYNTLIKYFSIYIFMNLNTHLIS